MARVQSVESLSPDLAAMNQRIAINQALSRLQHGPTHLRTIIDDLQAQGVTLVQAAPALVTYGLGMLATGKPTGMTSVMWTRWVVSNLIAMDEHGSALEDGVMAVLEDHVRHHPSDEPLDHEIGPFYEIAAKHVARHGKPDTVVARLRWLTSLVWEERTTYARELEQTLLAIELGGRLRTHVNEMPVAVRRRLLAAVIALPQETDRDVRIAGALATLLGSDDPMAVAWAEVWALGMMPGHDDTHLPLRDPRHQHLALARLLTWCQDQVAAKRASLITGDEIIFPQLTTMALTGATSWTPSFALPPKLQSMAARLMGRVTQAAA